MHAFKRLLGCEQSIAYIDELAYRIKTILPEEQLIAQKHYTQYLQDLSRIKYKADSKRSRRRSKSHCWSKN